MKSHPRSLMLSSLTSLIAAFPSTSVLFLVVEIIWFRWRMHRLLHKTVEVILKTTFIYQTDEPSLWCICASAKESFQSDEMATDKYLKKSNLCWSFINASIVRCWWNIPKHLLDNHHVKFFWNRTVPKEARSSGKSSRNVLENYFESKGIYLKLNKSLLVRKLKHPQFFIPTIKGFKRYLGEARKYSTIFENQKWLSGNNICYEVGSSTISIPDEWIVKSVWTGLETCSVIG